MGTIQRDYWAKYKIRDYRGGGRSSARETAMRVAAGAIARKVLETKIKKKFKIIGALVQIGDSKINYKRSLDTNDFDISFAKGLSLENGTTTITDLTSELLSKKIVKYSILLKWHKKNHLTLLS